MERVARVARTTLILPPVRPQWQGQYLLAFAVFQSCGVSARMLYDVLCVLCAACRRGGEREAEGREVGRRESEKRREDGG